MIKAMSKVFSVVIVILSILLLLFSGFVGYFVGSYYGTTGILTSLNEMIENLNYEFSIYCIFGAIIGLVIGFICDVLFFGFYAVIIQMNKNLDKINSKLK